LDIYVSEHIDLGTRQAVLCAYTTVGNREIRSRAYVPHRLYRQDHIDRVYNSLRNEVHRRALNEMRVQQVYDSSNAIVHSVTENVIEVAPGTFYDNREMLFRLNEVDDKVNWKEEGF
jgi:hypothetical protein